MPQTRLYVVSKIDQAPMWKEMRNRGLPIKSGWLDKSPVTEADFSALWKSTIVPDLRRMTHLLVYAVEGKTLKGGLLEVGAALVRHVPVFVVTNMPASILIETLGTWPHHEDIKVTRREEINDALDQVLYDNFGFNL